MPQIIKFCQQQLHFQRKRCLIDFASKLFPEGFDELFGEESCFLILPHCFLIKALGFVVEVLHLSEKIGHFVWNFMILGFHNIFFFEYLAMQLFV